MDEASRLASLMSICTGQWPPEPADAHTGSLTAGFVMAKGTCESSDGTTINFWSAPFFLTIVGHGMGLSVGSETLVRHSSGSHVMSHLSVTFESSFHAGHCVRSAGSCCYQAWNLCWERVICNYIAGLHCQGQALGIALLSGAS